MKISVIGMGYVGLVTGVCLAEKGHEVFCVDIDRGKIDKIKQSVSPLYETGLEALLRKNISKRLHATTNLYDAVINTDISLITVGTPIRGKEIDLSYVKEVSQQIGKVLRDKASYHLVIVKSTVIPGTTDEIVLPILEKTSGKQPGVDFGVGMNPEFLREGDAIQDFMFPDRIILGGMDQKSTELMERLYDIFPNVDKVKTNNKTAEMIKYALNSLLATMISFSNEIGNLCSTLGGIDIVEVMKGIHLDKRISPIMPNGKRIVPHFTTYLEAGCGFGGSCFPKDIKALSTQGAKAGNLMRLLEAVIEVNENQPKRVYHLLKKHFTQLKGVSVAILGLAFKPGTDDIRESPAIPIIKILLEEGVKIKAYDPVARHNMEKLFCDTDIVFCDDISRAINDVQAVVLLTRWEEFKRLPKLLAQKEQQSLVIDGRRMLDKKSIPKYDGIGL